MPYDCNLFCSQNMERMSTVSLPLTMATLFLAAAVLFLVSGREDMTFASLTVILIVALMCACVESCAKCENKNPIDSLTNDNLKQALRDFTLMRSVLDIYRNTRQNDNQVEQRLL